MTQGMIPDLFCAMSAMSNDVTQHEEYYGLQTAASSHRRVLILAYYFPPMGLSGVQRTLKFAKYIKRSGWEPTVITAGAVGYYALDQSLLDEAESAGIRIERTTALDVHALFAAGSSAGKARQVSMPREWLRKMASRLSASIFIPDNKVGWARQAYRRAKDLLAAERYEAIFVSAPPFSAARVGARLAKEFDLPFVVDYRDLWFGNQFAFYPTPLHRHLHRRFEYAMLTAAKKIIVTNRQMKAAIMATYPFLTFDDIVIIPHGFDPEDFAQAESDVLSEPGNRQNDGTRPFRLGYAGIFYEFVTPKYFLQAFKLITKEYPSIAARIELHFFGLLRKENERLIRRLGLTQYVRNHGYLDHKDSVRGIMSCDALWMMVGRARSAETISSGKLYEYFGSQKPIIASVPDGALAQSAYKYGAAFVTEPDNVQQIKLAILTLVQLFDAGQLPVPNREFVEQHRRDYLSELLAKELHEAADNS
jgi:glycosyltransferase involved in cell wall biosynthesis